MRIHILGICGTFMPGIAQIAKQGGHDVVGSDKNIYPPMSTQLESQGIKLFDNFEAQSIDPTIDLVIVGNIVTRGNPAMEYVLEKNLPYMSGPEWLAKYILKDRWVLAVAGTHGKTTTTSLLAWILDYNHKNPGFLIGGVPENFGISARIAQLDQSSYFVIEADEYDSAFFDKRSKFIHYHPKTLILNNLEFDHADIFADLEAIQQQFHYLVRTVPGNGLIIRHANDNNLQITLDKGCWTPVEKFGGDSAVWRAEILKTDGSAFAVFHHHNYMGDVYWNLLGNHNVENALAAIAAAYHAGVPVSDALKALPLFKNVKRRLEIKGEKNGVTVYDDFAHHPTAIATTLAGLRAKIGDKARIIAILEFGSYTMRSGVHKNTIQQSLQAADIVMCHRPILDHWGLEGLLKTFPQKTHLFDSIDHAVDNLRPMLKPDDHVVIMSNSGFGGIHQKLLAVI